MLPFVRQGMALSRSTFIVSSLRATTIHFVESLLQFSLA